MRRRALGVAQPKVVTKSEIFGGRMWQVSLLIACRG